MPAKMPMKTHAFRVHETGGPDVMKWEEVDLPKPKKGQVLIRHTAIGFNMVETYFRKGLYPPRDPMPMGAGLEAAGVIEAVGPGVEGFKPGNRVVYAGGPLGAYAEARVIDAVHLSKIPAWLDDETAAAALSKGRTVQYLFNRTHKLKRGDTILFHAAAGGVGLIACQWAKAVGATLIGTAGTDEKCRLAKRYGAKHVINYRKQDFVSEVMRFTKNKGVDVVYDSVGKDTWNGSIKCVRRLGLVVSFGSASGPPPPLDIAADGVKTSAYFTRATTVNYMTSPEIERASTRHLFRMMKSGAVKVKIGHTYRLRDAVQVHKDAEARKTTGAVVMIP